MQIETSSWEPSARYLPRSESVEFPQPVPVIRHIEGTQPTSSETNTPEYFQSETGTTPESEEASVYEEYLASFLEPVEIDRRSEFNDVLQTASKLQVVVFGSLVIDIQA